MPPQDPPEAHPNPVPHAVIPARGANALKKVLVAEGWLLPDTAPSRLEGGVAFPLNPAGSAPEIQQVLRADFPDVSFPALPPRARTGSRPRTLAEALAGKLPVHLERVLPKSWDIIGSVAVVEGPKDPLPDLDAFWGAIGEAVIAVNPSVTTVFLKASAVGGEFRTREYKCIAGPDASETTHRENECTFRVDIHKVFFSPRLVTERARVAHLPPLEGERVLDMFAGVGPFAIQRAKVRGVPVVAADKNRDAVEFLRVNVRANNLNHLVTPVWADAALLGKGELADLAGGFSRVIMNLPERAIEFIPDALRILDPNGGVIHFYQFSNAEDPLQGSIEHFAHALSAAGGQLVEVEGKRIVKPYAPREFLTVVDALCRPPA